MKFILPGLFVSTLLLSACSSSEEGDEATDSDTEAAEALGSYDIDPESGEVRATHTDEAGVTTTMRAGKKVPPDLPEPFLPYPDAEIVSTTRVDQDSGVFVALDFTTSDQREQVVAYYREQALDAGIAPEVEITGEDATTLGGENRSRGISFTLNVSGEAGRTRAQLSVASGFE